MKTIDEAAKEAYRDTSVSAENMFKAGVEFAQKWIDVNDELPENGCNVIAKLENGIKLGLCFSENTFWSHSTDKNSQVTHWRPIELV